MCVSYNLPHFFEWISSFVNERWIAFYQCRKSEFARKRNNNLCVLIEMGIWQSVLNKFDMIAEIKNT